MTIRGASGFADGSGQAAVELLGALPAVLLAALTLFQLLAVGYAAIGAGNAAEAAALALAAGGDERAAALAAAPGFDDDSLRLERTGGKVEVTVRPLSPIASVSRALAVTSTAVVAAP